MLWATWMGLQARYCRLSGCNSSEWACGLRNCNAQAVVVCGQAGQLIAMCPLLQHYGFEQTRCCMLKCLFR